MIAVYYAAKKDFADTEQFLQYILTRYYHLAESSIKKSENGKPYLLHHPLYFSVSHSKDLIAAAFFSDEIGFDMEFLGRTGDFSSLVRRFPAAEQAEITDISALLQHWTMRESYIKFKGETLAENFAKLSCYNGELYKENQSLPLVFQSGSLKNEYIYTICTNKHEKIETFKIQGES